MDFLGVLVVLAAANAGITVVINESSLFDDFRMHARLQSDFLGELVHCPMCLGVWVGAVEAAGFCYVEGLGWELSTLLVGLAVTFASMFGGLVFRRFWS